MEHSNLDRVLYKLNWHGRYQMIQMALVYVSVFPGSLIILSYIFVGYDGPHTCTEVANTSGFIRHGYNVGNDTRVSYGECQIDLQSNTSRGTLTEHLPCLAGNTYEEHKLVSMVSEWDLVCERASMSELTQTLFVLGQATGAIVCASMSDRFGRKLTYCFNVFMLLVLGLVLSFSPNYAVFATFRFLVGICQQGTDLTIATMILESVPTEKRFLAGTIGSALWGTALVTLAPIAYLLRNVSWRYLQIAVALTAAYSIILPFKLDETLRWLEANGKTKEINRILKKAAKLNNVPEEEVMKAYYTPVHTNGNGVNVNRNEKNICSQNTQTLVEDTKIPVQQVDGVQEIRKVDALHENKKEEEEIKERETQEGFGGDEKVPFLPIIVLDEEGKMVLSQDDNVDDYDATDVELGEDKDHEKKTTDTEAEAEAEAHVNNADTEQTTLLRDHGDVDEDGGQVSLLQDEGQTLALKGENNADNHWHVPLSEKDGLINHKPDHIGMQATKKYTLLDILKNRIILKNAIIVWYCWVVDSLVYYGLYMTSSTLAGNRYLNYFLVSGMEAPAALLIFLTLERFGRKRPSLAFHTTAGISLLVAVLLKTFAGSHQAALIMSTILNLVGKLTITTAFGTLFIYTPELFPTNLRNAGLGAASSVSRLGGTLSPFARTLEKKVAWAPGAIFAGMCLLAGYLIQFLPETRGHELPLTMEEIREWYKTNIPSKKQKGRQLLKTAE